MPRRMGVMLIAGLTVLLVALVTAAAVAAAHGTRGDRVAGSDFPSVLSSALASRMPSPSASPSSSRSPSPPRAPTIPAYDPALHNCGADPHICGYPDATNAGVQAGLSLLSVPGQASHGSGWSYSQGNVEVYGNGAVFAGYSVHGTVTVTGSNVVIKDDSISNYGNDISGDGVNLTGNPSNVTIEHTNISSPYGTQGSNGIFAGIKDINGEAQGTRVLANNIADASTGVQIYIGLIQDNYIHDVSPSSPSSHLNGTTSNGSTVPLTIQHNTIFNPNEQTDAVSLFEDFGVEANVVISGNLLAGGGYTVYGGQNPGGQQAYNIRITDNRFSTIYYPQSGFYGYITDFDPNAPGNAWSGNIWDNTGASVGS